MRILCGSALYMPEYPSVGIHLFTGIQNELDYDFTRLRVYKMNWI